MIVLEENGKARTMGAIKGFIDGYSDSFILAVGLWPFFSALLTLPILAVLYRRDGRLRLGSVIATYLSVLYLIGLACFTLYPLPSGEAGPGITYGIPPQLNPLAFVGDIAKDGVRAVAQIVANVIFFVPLGFIFGRLLRWSLPRSAVMGLLTSLLIETAQLTGFFGLYPYAYRTFDVDDLAWNTSGALIGWGIAALVNRVLPEDALSPEQELTRSPGFVRRCVAFWLDVTLVWATALVVVTLVQVLARAFGWEQLDQAAFELLSFWVFGAGFVLAEGVVPLLRGGCTLGGSFVRMTCETRERTGARRVAFFAVRLAVLAALVAFSPVMVPAMIICYAVARQMPYDAL